MTLDSYGVYLIVLMAAFIGIVAWAFSARRKKRFERDGKIPFTEDD
jgi:cbb3-type cytochrome oxidase subunit 3